MKRFSLSRAGHTRSFAELLEEAKKCILLCGNCHAEVEAGVTTLPAGLLPPDDGRPDAKVSSDSPG